MKTAEQELLTQKRYTIHGNEWLAVSYTLFFPISCKNGNKRKRDLGNFEKPLSDFLTTAIPGFKDEHIISLTMRKVDSPVERCIVEVSEEI